MSRTSKTFSFLGALYVATTLGAPVSAEFAGAKWIVQDAAGQPDWPVDGVSWLTLSNNGTERRFTLKEVPATATLAAAGFRRIEVLVNGKMVLDDTGEWFNPSHLKFADIASALKPGENTLVVRPVERAPGCDNEPTHGVFILTLDAGDVRIVSDDSWARAKVFSPARKIPFGRAFSFRHEARSPAFRKAFSLAATPKKATLRITAPGFYEASLNGRRIGDRVLDPSPTDFDKRVYYSTYDVTDSLRVGANEITVLLGHGWYDCAADRVWNFDHAPWRAAPQMIARLDCELADGTKSAIVSDATWEQVENPVLSDNFRVGETATGAAGGRAFGPAVETAGPKGVLEPARHHPTKVVRELKPVGLERLEDGAWRVTFGENFTGWVRARLRGLKKGAAVTFVYDECLDRPRAIGEFEPDVQTVRYVAGGAAEETFEPRFTYYGFRFVTIRGLAESPRAEDFTGCFVRTSFPKTGRFTCSDADFNALFAATERSYEGNFTVGFPTDCPHREKNGWTADAAMAVEFGLLDYDTTADYRKWLQDLVDAQRPSGMIPAIVPTGGWGSFIFDGCGYGPIWDSAPYAVAHGLWRHRADLGSVRLAYPSLVRHFRFAETQLDADGLIGKFNGDHVARKGVQPDNRYCCTVYHLFNVERLAELADALGDAQQAADCGAAAARLRQTLVRFFYRGDGVWDDGRETAQALAVDFALAPESEAAATAAQLVRAVEAEGGHFSFGITGSRHLLRALSKVGRTDLAFAGLVKKTDPSPLLWLADGGGTLWETWDGKSSRNHIMFGDFAAWAYAHLAGITPLDPGYAKIRLAPEPIAALTHVEASVETPYGTVSSSWRRDGQGVVEYRFEVPDGVTAEIVLQQGERAQVGGGVHTFSRRQDPLRVVLTFDDALKDHLLIAAPLLEKHGWRGTFNVVTDWVGKDDRHLSWDDVRELVRRGHEVTTHTVSHANLLQLIGTGQTNEVRRQLAQSRDLIAEKTGFAPRYMCAPYVQQGDVTERICREENLHQMNVQRVNFGSYNSDKVESVVMDKIAHACVRMDILHHGVSAADRGGWCPFPDRESFERHLDVIGDMERKGLIVVTDYEGCASDCALRAKEWPRHGVVALSFDDRNLEGWERAFPLLERYGATATFCIAGAIDPVAVAFARRALSKGHEIALHGLRHRNADSAIAEMGESAYWDEEIAPQLAACNAARIPIRSFAYPNCRHDEVSDALLSCRGFTRLRGSVPGGKSPNPYDPQGGKLAQWRPVAGSDSCFLPAADHLTERCISNVVLGESYHTDMNDIIRAMDRAGSRGERISLVSHDISPGAGGINMKTEWLERILSEANRLGVVVHGLR